MLTRQSKDSALTVLVWASAAITITFLLWILFYIVTNGANHVSWSFVTSTYTRLGGVSGIWPMIVTTVYMVVLSIGIAAPIGIMTAI